MRCGIGSRRAQMKRPARGGAFRGPRRRCAPAAASWDRGRDARPRVSAACVGSLDRRSPLRFAAMGRLARRSRGPACGDATRARRTGPRTRRRAARRGIAAAPRRVARPAASLNSRRRTDGRRVGRMRRLALPSIPVALRDNGGPRRRARPAASLNGRRRTDGRRVGRMRRLALPSIPVALRDNGGPRRRARPAASLNGRRRTDGRRVGRMRRLALPSIPVALRDNGGPRRRARPGRPP